MGGAAMVGVSQMGRTMRELRDARETIADLAANEERLRLARDLHDLLGHSLSLITLKSELAGRMLPDRPAGRRPAGRRHRTGQPAGPGGRPGGGQRLPAAHPRRRTRRRAHRAAHRGGAGGDPRRPDASLAAAHPGLGADEEGALAWALREAVTNVVRHSGAQRCELVLDEVSEGDDCRYLRLEIADDGRGPGRLPHRGNGLSGLEERLVLSGGSLRTGRSSHGGFSVRAQVPLRPARSRRREVRSPSYPQG